jgi:hypothetical protein
MATKPTSLPEWATGSGSSVVEPATGQKQQGHEVGRKTPAGWQNWYQKLVYDWIQFLNAIEGTAPNGAGLSATGAGTGPGFEGTGGGSSGPGLKGTGGAPNGNGGEGVGTGAGAGLRGTTTTGTANGVIGLNTAGASNTGAGVKGQGTNVYGVIAEGGVARSALRIVPQAADPTNQQKGDVQTDSTTGLPKVSNGTSMLHLLAQRYALTQLSDELTGDLITAGANFQLAAADIEVVIPANTLRAGSVIHFSAMGNFTLDADASPDDLEFFITLGGDANIIGKVVASMTAGETGNWNIQGCATLRAPGAAATFSAQSVGGCTVDTIPETVSNYRFGGNVLNVDTTAALSLKARIRMTDADADDSFFLQNFVVSVT